MITTAQVNNTLEEVRQRAVNALVDDPTITFSQAEILEQLITNRYRRLLATDIADFVYSRYADGGPDSAISCVYVQISHLRRKLEKYGLEINSSGRGRGHWGYQLKILPEKILEDYRKKT